MARPIEHDRDEVLTAAMRTFWHRGYEGTSVRDLVDACGLTTRSMYDSFGDKAHFFEAALDHYHRLVLTPVIDLLSNTRGMRALEEFVSFLSKAKSKDGCLFVNTGGERHRVGDAALGRVEAYTERLRRLFEKKLVEARTDGEFAGDPVVRAAQLGLTVNGYQMGLKCGMSHDSVTKVLRQVLADIKAG